MYKIIIFGTGRTSKLVTESLNDNVEILAYTDNNNDKLGKKYFNKNIISPQCINNIDYDFLVIGSQFNEEIYIQLLSMGIPKNKILQFFKFVDLSWNMFKYQMDNFVNSKEKIEMLATGISYTNMGLREDILNRKCFKFSIGSQDIYYDYNIVNYIIENYKQKAKDLKYVIIGLSYYSFQYDMSLSTMKNKVILYYEVLKKKHHFIEVEDLYNEYETNKNIADKIFYKNKDDSYIIKWDIPVFGDIQHKELIGKVQAEIDCKKNYPKTVEENKEIFRKYLKLLKENNIKPILVVFPASKYYVKYFSEEIEKEFKSIITNFMEDFDFQYIDYFKSNLFNDEDFSDTSHLNPKGAEKFTNMLNEKIMW
ncbi:TPA: chemotaxis protein [Clostridium sporogenes]|uniref:chemotaxis protein n=1 Tax=Clostridium botulinum TaxID=1491 RepID=UPI000D12D1F6|nr:chemotaxis protein [Clostridium botulinum]AVQ44398.1 chemotaxis protein [Clostridium botulinum]AVQ47941.1 chemotaxis protein [Clostridium botulinum]